jgi:3-oxoacyl-[acyl-carrier protein] reductase
VANKKLDGIVLIPPRPSFVTTSGIPLESEWNQVFKLTYMGPLDVLKRMIPYVKVGGSVVLISGSSSLQYLPNYPNTNVVRLAWIGELKNLVYYLSPYKIRVNAISPAIILTPFNITKIQKRAAEKGKSFKDELEAVTSHTPLRRYGEPEDVAKVVYFLLSDLASHVNGVNLPVDGGESLTY